MLRDNMDAHIFLFVNFCSDVSYCSSSPEGLSKSEELLANELMREDVLPINEHMDKIEKFAHVRLFTCSIVLRSHRFQVLVATSAANTGIDQPRIKLVTRYDLPRDTTTLLQERINWCASEEWPGVLRYTRILLR